MTCTSIKCMETAVRHFNVYDDKGELHSIAHKCAEHAAKSEANIGSLGWTTTSQQTTGERERRQ